MNILQLIITLNLLFILQSCNENTYKDKDIPESTNSITDFPNTADPDHSQTQRSEDFPTAIPSTPETNTTNDTSNENSSDCAEDFQVLNWDGSQHMNRLSFGEISYSSNQIGSNIIPALSGFTISFSSPVYIKNWNKTSRTLPKGLSLKISETLQYDQFRDIKLTANDFKKDSAFNITSTNVRREISIVSFNLTSDFFIKNELATKKLKFDLICKNKLYATDMDFMIRSQVSSRIQDYYQLHSEGDRILSDANGIHHRYMYVDRSIDGASALLSCSSLSAKVGDTILCSVKSDKINLQSLQWKIDDKINSELNGQSVLRLNAATATSTTIRVKANSTGGFPVSSNLIKVIFK